MKRLLLFLLIVGSAHAAGSVQQSLQQIGTSSTGQPTTYVLAFTWTGDASTGTVPATAGQGLSCCQGWFPVQVETSPGSPNPTNGYSVTITDSAGFDILAGAATSLSSTNPQSFATSTAATPIQGTLTLNITGQSVAGAKGTVYVFMNRPGVVNTAKLGTGIASSANWLTIANSPFVDARIYKFSPQTPGGTLSSGACSFIMIPLPPGVLVGDGLYISGGTGAAEVLSITGLSGSTVSGTCANSHSGAWTVQSSTGGGLEASLALQQVGAQATIMFPAGTTQIYGPISVTGAPFCYMGWGPENTFLNNNSNTQVFNLSSSTSPIGGGCIAQMSITAGGTASTSIAGSTGTAIQLNGNGASFSGFSIHDIAVRNHNVSIDLEGVLGTKVYSCTLQYQNTYGLKLNGTAYVDFITISNSGGSGLPANASGAGLIWVAGIGAYFHQIDIAALPTGVLIQPLAQGLGNGFFSQVLADTSNFNGWVFDGTTGSLWSQELDDCWGAFNGCYSPATLNGNINNSVTSLTVTPSSSQPYPTGTTVLTIDTENIQCTSYSTITNVFSGCTRGFNGTAPAGHTSGVVVFVCGSSAGDGLQTRGVTNNVQDIKIIGGRWNSNGGNGINLTVGKNIQISGATVSSNSQYQSGQSNDIAVAAAISNWEVTGSRIGSFANTQNDFPLYGISVAAGSSDNYNITGNAFAMGAGSTAPINDNGTGIHKVIANNDGVDNAGAPTVASAATISLGTLDQPLFYISGTTAITTINGGWVGRQISLIFTNAAPAGIATGGNIGRTQSAVTFQRISLMFDGTNWY